MRILIVAMVNSVHTNRWIEQFHGDDDKVIYAFPSTLGGAKDELRRWPRLYGWLLRLPVCRRALVVHLPLTMANGLYHRVLSRRRQKDWRAEWLVKTIDRIKPDIVHSLEFQHAGYVCLDAKRRMKGRFPTWIATNWGSDIYLFSQLKAHQSAIAGILTEADFYSAECARDYDLARAIGMKAEALPVIPNAGGFHLEQLARLRSAPPPSRRSLLLIKGYQMLFGRAMTALHALEDIAEELKKRGTEICIFSATEDIEVYIELVANRSGLNIRVIPTREKLSHDEMLALQAKARCYVGVSISDGISTSMLEAMALGAFPIQTCTSCADEWIEDGVTGFIAPSYDDHRALGQLMLRALTEDTLVDTAAFRNWETIRQKADWENVRRVARGFYDAAYAKKRADGAARED